VFNDDEDILNFFTSEESYYDQVINEDEHDKKLNELTKENSLHKPIVKLEDLYDLKYRLKRVTNYKLES